MRWGDFRRSENVEDRTEGDSGGGGFPVGGGIKLGGGALVWS
jgi:predicted metalloprotease